MPAGVTVMGPLGSFANYSTDELAARTFASARTARRWKRLGMAPRVVIAWLELITHGALGVISATWAGWRLSRGELVSPDGHTFTPAEIAALPLRMQQIAALESERARERPPEPDPEQQVQPERREARGAHLNGFDHVAHLAPSLAGAEPSAPITRREPFSSPCHWICPSCSQTFALVPLPAAPRTADTTRTPRAPRPVSPLAQ